MCCSPSWSNRDNGHFHDRSHDVPFVSIDTLHAYSIMRMERNAGCGSVDVVIMNRNEARASVGRINQQVKHLCTFGTWIAW